MTCQDARELFSAALDDALDAGERERLHVHLTGCGDCQRERERLERTVSLLRDAEPLRAPAGFVDRVLTIVRPQPWWRRLARWLVTPWAVKLPLEATAVALVAVTAVYLYRETPAPRHVVQEGTPVQERAARSLGAPSPATESRDAVGGESLTSSAREPSPPAEFLARPAPHEDTPVPLSSVTTPRPPTAVGPPVAPPPPPAAPPEQALSQARRPARTDAAPPPAELKRGESGATRERLTTSAEQSPPRQDEASRLLAKTQRAAPIGVEGHLSGIEPASGRARVAELVTRLGGAIVAEPSQADSAVIDIVLPRARYDELTRGLAQLGQWTASDLAGDADPVRILVRLVD